MNFLYYNSSNEFDSISLDLEGRGWCDFQLCGNIGSGAIGNEFDYQEARVFVRLRRQSLFAGCLISN